MTTSLQAVRQAVYDFPLIAAQAGYLDPLDQIYVRNQLLALLDLDGLGTIDTLNQPASEQTLLDVLDVMLDYAVAEGVIDPSQAAHDRLSASIMNLITPLPSEVNRQFYQRYEHSPQSATDYLYQLAQANQYIQTRRLEKNISFSGASPYGDLEVTINLAKPEKDPVEIARALTASSVNYPPCPLCFENEGYLGNDQQAARSNHRIIRHQLGDEEYGFQYSPYLYYNEHAIIMNREHRPMRVDHACLSHLLAFVTQFPHYFAGSNADLPGVGGSILSHDHYQAGRYQFPMERARLISTATLGRYPKVSLSILYWPLSVIRLNSADPSGLLAVADTIVQQWRNYSDPVCDIYAYTDAAHNTVTPIVRRRGNDYEMDLVLRNNRTSEDYPLGIFHPHPDLHHIKRENIGLIEVMGLAILPPRLAAELAPMVDYLVGQGPLESLSEAHRPWAQSLAESCLGLSSRPAAIQLLRQGLTDKFTQVLEDAGVYKQDPQGQAGLCRFIQSLALD